MARAPCSDRADQELTLHWQLDLLDRWGNRHDKVAEGRRSTNWKPYEVVPVGDVELSVPNISPAIGALCVWVTGEDGKRVAAGLFLPALLGEVFWSAAILVALGTTFGTILDLDFNTSILISAAVVR